MDREKIGGAIKTATLWTEDRDELAGVMLTVSTIRVLIGAAQELLDLPDRDEMIRQYMFLRSQNESLLGGLRKLYEDARAEQDRQAAIHALDPAGISDIDSTP